MSKSACLLFPFRKDKVTSGMERSNTVEKALTSSIKCFLYTKKNSRLGNPIGSILPDLLHYLNNSEVYSSKQDELKDDLAKQFPEVDFTEVLFYSGNGTDAITVYLKVKYYTPLTDLVQFDMQLNTN